MKGSHAPRFRFDRLAFRLVVIVVFAFLLISPLVVIYYSFSPGVVLKIPPKGFSLEWYGNFFAQKRLAESVLTSTLVALFSAFVALLIGVPTAYALVRSRLPGRAALSAFFLSPLNLPGMVLAIGILMFFVEAIQPLVKVRLIGALPPLLAAHLIVTVPWVIRTVSASLETSD
ncbi:MAG: hypothetical protein WCL50_16040, partial [Spirochaetota bacterium]